MKSALFVDFDNVYTQLRQLLPEAAERFARQPGEWIRWLVESLEMPDNEPKSERRRLLVRRCYLNPNWYQQYRHAFLRAGFEIVDCPPVTSQGKTSTDIHMVLDIIDLLQHETRYDEFIVFSADADFTPVLRKLRRYDRRTTVLAIGYPSAAYQASADLMIDERWFVEGALGLGGPGPAGMAATASAERVMADELPAVKAAEPNAAETPGQPSGERLASPEELTAIAQLIATTLELSDQPVPASMLALRIRQANPHLGENWNGFGAFKPFFQSLGLSHLAWANGSGGRVYDPERHDVAAPPQSPALESDAHWAGEEATFEVVREVCALTGAPLLAPTDLHTVIELLAEDLAQHPFELAATARRVCESCQARRQLRVSMRDVLFLLRGMRMNGHVFGHGQDDRHTLAERLVNQILFLCEREQLLPDAAAVARIRRWIAGDGLA
jgi:NYN domain